MLIFRALKTNRTVNERLTAERKRLISVIQSERIHQWNDLNDRNEEIKNTAFEKLENELGKLLHKELETLNERIDDFSKMLLQSSSRPEPEPVPVPDRLRIVSRPVFKSSTEKLTYLERYFAQQAGKNDKAIQWMNDRYDQVKKYYEPFENSESVNVAVFMGLIYPEAKTGFREGLYNGGFLGEMIQWIDILTALNSFKKIVMVFK